MKHKIQGITLLGVNKSHGPDYIYCCLLKSCAQQLTPAFHNIFNKDLEAQDVSIVWMDAFLVLVPKSSYLKTLNAQRPVGLTPIVIKYLKSKKRLRVKLRETEDVLDSTKFIKEWNMSD